MTAAASARDPLADRDLLAIRDFAELVVASARSSRQRDRVERASRVPVTGASLAALRIVARHEPLAVSDLAQRLNVDLSTTSRQLRPLDELKLVRRAVGDDDRRVAWLTITAKGRAMLDRVDAVMLNDFDVAMSDWPAEERHRLAALLERFRLDLLRTRTDASGWSVAKD